MHKWFIPIIQCLPFYGFLTFFPTLYLPTVNDLSPPEGFTSDHKPSTTLFFLTVSHQSKVARIYTEQQGSPQWERRKGTAIRNEKRKGWKDGVT